MYKIYHDINERTYVRKKAGEVGKSHSVARTRYINLESMVESYRSSYETSCITGYGVSDIRSYFIPSRLFNSTLNSVIDKFEGKCGPSAALGSSIFAEGKETVAAAVGLLERQASILRAMRRRDLVALKRHWDRPRTVKSACKKAGGKWLEFSFGWIPLVNTVADAMSVTCGDFPPTKINAKSYVDLPINNIKGYYDWSKKGSAKWNLKIGYDVRVENPNTWLLGSLGLINPIEWIWEAIPYSFFVDYFINVGDIIHNLSSFAGLSFSNGYTTECIKWDVEYWYRQYSDPFSFHHRQKGFCIGRQGPTPLRRKLVLADNPLTSSWQRGANAVSFMIQFLK